MWRYLIANYCLIVLLQPTLSCSCSNNACDRHKGETGTFDFKDKGQLDIHEVSPSEVIIESLPKEKQAEINKLLNKIFTVSYVTKGEQNITTTTKEPTKSSTKKSTKVLPKRITKPTKKSTKQSTRHKSSSKRSTTNLSGSTAQSSEETNSLPEIVHMSSFIANGVTSVELNDENEIDVRCDTFKRTRPFNITRMADVWKIVYYTMPHRLKCFKIHIKALSSEDQARYAKVYGDFNNTVNWPKCNLEIKSSDGNRKNFNRKHFLQACNSNQGVMENIIIEEEHFTNTTSLSLHRENADQWLVIKNLLLMRDCSTGDLVVFTRVPSEPRLADVEDALQMFGETAAVNGTMACQNPANAWVRINSGTIVRY